MTTSSSAQALGRGEGRSPVSVPTAGEGSPGAAPRAGLVPTLVLAVTLSAAAFLLAASLLLLVVHPNITPEIRAFATLVNQQNQNAKTGLYVVGFVIIPLLALVVVPRIADRLAVGPNGAGLPVLAGSLAGTLAVAIILTRLSSHLPWGDGLGVVLALVGAWTALTTAVLARAIRRPWPSLLKVAGASSVVWSAAAASLFGAILSVSDLRALRILPLLLGAAAIVAVLTGHRRIERPRAGRAPGTGIDLIVVLVILLAVPDTVIFQTSSAIPNAFIPPGVVQFQHDWIIGPANQLRAGGVLLVNSPISQYGVGMLYFLAGWFHLVPISYGSFGALDGILTALFSAAGYLVLRFAGTSRLLAASVLALAVAVLAYKL
ncbi:MAG: hypothetical protein ACR2L9_09135, partial [Solirubrobacteraceae bacterium]